MPTDPYSLPNGTLRNRLGIDDAKALEAAEADITGARLVALGQLHLPGSYDLDHLRAFHRYIFGDVYEWAGELRRVDITKFDTFCRWIHLDAYGSEVFGKLAQAGYLRGKQRADFVTALAEAYADINALHPFREGNGRAQRAFLQQLALDAGHPLTWANLNATENEKASIAGFKGDLAPLTALLGKLVELDR
jgi:cell filamentation protein